MSESSTRRKFIKDTGRIAVASALTTGTLSRIYAGENNTIKIALVGCGGRGTGAVSNALSVKHAPVRLVALADLFAARLTRSLDALQEKHADLLGVPADRQFLGFNAYVKAMDCLDPGDVVILGTPAAFRWVHFTYAIQKGLHVFMEKPVTVDGPTTRRFLKLAEESVKKNLKVGVGLMFRHCRGRQELQSRIDKGQIGDIMAMRANEMGACQGCARKPEGISEVLYQVKNFRSFLWASGGRFGDSHVHQIDECSWMKGSWPIEAHALGGRHYRDLAVDQNLDTYAVEYTYPDGTKLFYSGRYMKGCRQDATSYIHGSKGLAVTPVSLSPGKVRIYKGHLMEKEQLFWCVGRSRLSSEQTEWDDFIEAIRWDKPYNEAKRGAIASLVTSMGRMAAHTGQVVTYDQMLHCEHEFAPGLDKLTEDGPAPVQPDANRRYRYQHPPYHLKPALIGHYLAWPLRNRARRVIPRRLAYRPCWRRI